RIFAPNVDDFSEIIDEPPMRSTSSTMSAVNPVNAVTEVNAVKNPASAVGGRIFSGLLPRRLTAAAM
ncbi:MAG: hypothetical protein ACKO9Q_05715, partial [Pirellula sp.]